MSVSTNSNEISRPIAYQRCSEINSHALTVSLTWATVITSFITSRDSASASEEEVNHSRVLVLVNAVKLFHAQFLVMHLMNNCRAR